jgi:hypothetical protein
MTHHNLRIIICAIVASVLLAGVISCSAPPATGHGTGRQHTPGSVTVRQDYLAYWKSLIAANSIPDPGSPLLARHTASSQLALLRRNLSIDVSTHIYAAGSVSHDIRSIRVQGTVAYVVDCVNVDSWLLYRQHTRTLIPQLKKRPPQLAMFTLAKAGRIWKVTESTVYGDC